MRYRLIIPICIWLVSLSQFSNAQYSIQNYFHDMEVADSLHSALDDGNLSKAKDAYSKLTNANPYLRNMTKARIEFATGQSSRKSIDLAFAARCKPAYINTTDSFYLANKTQLDSLMARNCLSPEEQEVRSTVLQLIETDQKNVKSDSFDIEISRGNKRVLDSIISAYGWPSAQKLGIPGSGAGLILAHQDEDLSASDFDRYYKLVASLALNGMESWTYAVGIANWRAQYWASNLRYNRPDSDTIKFESGVDGMIKDDYAIGYVLSHAQSMANNSKSTYTYTVPNKVVSDQIEQLILGFRYLILPPVEVQKMLVAQGFDLPSQVSSDRLKMVIDSSMPEHVFAYRNTSYD